MEASPDFAVLPSPQGSLHHSPHHSEWPLSISPLEGRGGRAGHIENTQWMLENSTKSGRDHLTVQMGKLRLCRKRAQVPRWEIVEPCLAPSLLSLPAQELFSAQATRTSSLTMEGQSSVKGLTFIYSGPLWGVSFFQPGGVSSPPCLFLLPSSFLLLLLPLPLSFLLFSKPHYHQ